MSPLRILTIILLGTASLSPAVSAQDIRAIAQEARADLKAGRHTNALSAYRSLEKIAARNHPQQWGFRAGIADKIAQCLAGLRRLDDAVAAHAEAIAFLDKGQQPNATTATTIRLNAARFHLDTLDDWQAAEQALTPALTATPTSDPAHLRTLALARTTLGEIQRESLRWNEAIETLETATADCAALPVPEDPVAARNLELETARAHHSLGRLLLDLGENTSALNHLQRANKIYFSNIREAGNPNRVHPRINLARAHSALDQFNIATDLLGYTLAELKSPAARSRADNNELETRTLQTLASAHFEAGNFPAAVRYNRQIVAPERAALVSPSETATALSNFAIAKLLATGDTASASKNVNRALETLATLPDSIELFDYRFSTHFNRAMIRHHAGDSSGALADASAAVAEVRKSFDQVFVYLPPEVRLSYSQKLATYPFHLAGTLADPGFAADVTIQIKGLVSDSVARDRAMLASIDKRGSSSELTKLRQLQHELATLSLRGGDTSQKRSDIRAIRNSVLGDRSTSSLDQPPSLAEIQSALAHDETAIDFFTFRNNRAAAGWSWDIAAVVLRSDQPAALYTIPADSVARLGTLLDQFHKRLADTTSISATAGDPDQWCREVYTILFGHRHARQALSATSTLTLIPDGILHAIPFAALRAETGQPLGHSHAIRHVNSLRDLLSPAPTSTAGTRSALLVGNPDFKFSPATPSPQSPDASIARRTRSPIVLEPGTDSQWGKSSITDLPGTATELEQLGTILSLAGYNVDTLTRQQPTEPAVRSAVSGAGIVHFATHGFFIDDSAANPASRNSSAMGLDIADPMLRSGLALAGAELTRLAWKDQRVPNTAGDGILLATELAAMDFRSARLVVLSACDTARGDPAAAQGIQGILRALAEAGCPNIITTLWPIDDQETVPLMHKFYAAYLDGQPPHLAMATAQRSQHAQNSELDRWRAIFYYTPFVVTSRGTLR